MYCRELENKRLWSEIFELFNKLDCGEFWKFRVCVKMYRFLCKLSYEGFYGELKLIC